MGTELKSKKYSESFYIFGFLSVCVLVYLMWYSYKSFYENQDLCYEPFISKTIKTGTDYDKVFDVESEVNKLREMQENFLYRQKNN